MEHGLRRIVFPLTLLVGGSFVLTPLVTCAISLYFGLLDMDTLRTAGLPLFVLYLVLVSASIAYMRHLLRPVFDWIITHPSKFLPEQLAERLASFGSHYWGLLLLGVLLLPTAQHWLGLASPATGASQSLLQFVLLHLVVAALGGMPAYLAALSLLGQLARYTGVDRVHMSMRSKMLIIGAWIPLLIEAVLLRYYQWRTAELPLELLISATLLGALGVTVTLLAARSMSQGLAPLDAVSSTSGASSHSDLVQRLRPRSHDEFGFLMQTLARLFRRLGEQDATVHAIVDNAAEGIVVVDAEGAIQLANPAAARLFDTTPQELHGRPLAGLLPEVAHPLRDELTPGEELEIDYRQRDSRRVLSVRTSSMEVEQAHYRVCLIADITRRKEAEHKVVEAEARYRNLVETAHDLVWSMDPQGRWTYLNQAAMAIYHLPPADMLGRHFTEFQAPGHGGRDDEALASLLAGKELVHYETVHQDRHGAQHHLSFNARPIFDEQGHVSYITGTARDITEQKAYEQELTYQAEHDTLTGLYNRKYFHQELNRVIARVARSGATCALFYLDLDQFKYINDTLGHAAGDQLLNECTTLLRKHTRDGDLLARFGGDEFTVLLYNVNGPQAMAAAENLRDLFERFSFFYDKQSFSITCSIGVSLIDNRAETADDVLAHADLACNLAKSQGRNRVHLYAETDPHKADLAEDMGWAARVRDAYENDHFVLMFQPIMSMHDGSVNDYETLLRIRTADNQFILPGGFMPAAERFGLIHNVDRWTIRHAIRRLGRLHAQGLTTRFAINLSGCAVEDQSLVELVRNELRDNAVPAEAITFELTETAAIANLRGAAAFIHSLRDLGCRFALDDFGSGFCSFAYLKHLPVDMLKIDGSFVQGLTQGQVDQAMVQSMANVAHALDKKTVAEFVEDEATMTILQEFDVDFAQGHFIGHPDNHIPGEDSDHEERVVVLRS
ncbi:MAG TPA: EAL domain-containing protein [Gammaproteobacteria bacterium]|nr:EAL domain-containing protein [Gammaproteobacteria bacterium]